MMRALAFTAVGLFVLQLQSAPWRPPIGIPMPPVGITEVAPAPTLYVDWARGLETNPGTQARPKKTFPAVLPACTHVRIVGAYPVPYEPPNQIVSKGTKDCPVWITGEQGGAFTSMIIATGTYLFFERLTFSGFGSWSAQADGQDTQYSFIRDSEFTKAGFGVQGNYLGETGRLHHIVFLRINCHDLGDMNTATDQDVMCMGVYKQGTDVWWLDSTATRVSSDTSQANAFDRDPANVARIYYGRNTCDRNRQGCFWAKQSTDVVMSENVCRNMRPDKSGENPGHCYGAQYGARRLFIIHNLCEDSENCIRFGGGGANAVVGWNLARRIHATSTKTSTPWSGGAFLFAGQEGGPIAVVNNTVDDADSLINSVYGGPQITVFNTAITRVGERLKLEDPSRTKVSTSDYAVHYREAGAGDYRLVIDSPGVGQGLPLDPKIREVYQSLHKVPLDLPTANVGAEWFGSPVTPAPTSPPPTIPPVSAVPPPAPAPLPPCNAVQRWARSVGFIVRCV